METLRESEQAQEQASRTLTPPPSRHPSAFLFRPLEDKGNEPPKAEKRNPLKQKTLPLSSYPRNMPRNKAIPPDPFRWRNRLMTLLVDKLSTYIGGVPSRPALQ